jgi:hypothetical protein
MVLVLLLVLVGVASAEYCTGYVEMPMSQEDCRNVLQDYINDGSLEIRPIGNTTYGHYSGTGLFFSEGYATTMTVADVIGAVVVTLKAYPNTTQVHVYCGEILDSIFRVEGDQLCCEKF